MASNSKYRWGVSSWLLFLALLALGAYTFLGTVPKSEGLPLRPLEAPTASAPTLQERHDPSIIEPMAGIKVLRFWDSGEWHYVSGGGQNGLNLKNIAGQLLGGN